MDLYDLLWDAVRGEHIDAFREFIYELKGEENTAERFAIIGFDVNELSRDSLKNIPLPVRFVVLLEELLSALIVEVARIEVHIPYECGSLKGFLEGRLEVARYLKRDLIQEKHEYNLDPSFISKAVILTDSYIGLCNSLLSLCNS